MKNFKEKEDYKNYILFTRVWNNEKDIQKTFEMVFNFTLRPKLWVWIDDGSTDSTKYRINKCIQRYGITMPTVIVTTPLKKLDNLPMIGQAYNFAFDALNLKDMKYDFEFMATIDVKNVIHPQYFEKISQGFNVEQHIGVISGKYKNVKQRAPMGCSKAVRWWIVRNIERFWDPAPDMQLNIESKDMNQGWIVLDQEVGIVGGPTTPRNRTTNGAYYAGSLWRYVGGSYHGMFQRVVYRLVRRRYGFAFLRGFLENKNYWICDDKKIIAYYKSGLLRMNDKIIYESKKLFDTIKQRVSKGFNILGKLKGN